MKSALPERKYVTPPVPSTVCWGLDLEKLTAKVDQMRSLVMKLAKTDNRDDVIVRAAVILLAATIAGQHQRSLELVTGDHPDFIHRIKRAALDNKIFVSGHRGSYPKVDVTDWFAPHNGLAVLILDAKVCLGLMMRTMRQGDTRYLSVVTQSKDPKAPKAEPILIKPRKPRAPAPKMATPAAKAIPVELRGSEPADKDFWWLSENWEAPKVTGIDPASHEHQVVRAAFDKVRSTGLPVGECYLHAVRAWLRLHPDHDRRAAAQRAAAIVMGADWQTMMQVIRHRLDELPRASLQPVRSDAPSA